MNPALPRPDLYICIVSDHNIAELEACVTRRPIRIWLINSGHYSEQAKRLLCVLQQHLPDSEIERIEDAELHGEYFDESLRWAQTILKPRLDEYAAATRVLNLNGGTKSLALALATLVDWSWIDYKPFRMRELEAFSLQTREGTHKVLDISSPADISVRDAASLYSQISWITPPASLHSCEHRVLAQDLWDALDHGDKDLSALFELLATPWSTERHEQHWQHPRITCDWHALPPNRRPGAKRWLLRLTAQDKTSTGLNGSVLTIPGNARNLPKSDRAWKRWVSGEWMEHLAYHWLAAVLPAHHLELNPRSQQLGDGSESREADLLVLHNSQTWVIEIKTDLPPGARAADVEQQISSLGESRFGKIKKVILYGPQFRARFSDSQWQSFTNRCLASHVFLCGDRQALYRALQLTDHAVQDGSFSTGIAGPGKP